MIAIYKRISIEITLENATNFAVYALIHLFSIIDYRGAQTGLTGTQPHPQVLKWFRTFSYLFGPHGETLTSQ